jgi:caffeoyl-CoA O-methyltransferase
VSGGAIIDEAARAVMARLEARDAEERARGEARPARLRQVTPEVGQFLHALVLAARPRAVVEVGTSGGYSTVWLGTAARHVGARVTTLEVDPAKVALATSTLREADLDGVVTVVAGDASAWLRARRRPVDFVFLDAEKEDYVAFFELIAPLLRRGGVLVADNLLSHAGELAPFRERVLGDAGFSALVVPIGRGELLAVRTGA